MSETEGYRPEPEDISNKRETPTKKSRLPKFIARATTGLLLAGTTMVAQPQEIHADTPTPVAAAGEKPPVLNSDPEINAILLTATAQAKANGTEARATQTPIPSPTEKKASSPVATLTAVETRVSGTTATATPDKDTPSPTEKKASSPVAVAAAPTPTPTPERQGIPPGAPLPVQGQPWWDNVKDFVANFATSQYKWISEDPRSLRPIAVVAEALAFLYYPVLGTIRKLLELTPAHRNKVKAKHANAVAELPKLATRGNDVIMQRIDAALMAVLHKNPGLNNVGAIKVQSNELATMIKDLGGDSSSPDFRNYFLRYGLTQPRIKTRGDRLGEWAMSWVDPRTYFPIKYFFPKP